MAEYLARETRIIDDDKLNAHLREIGDRLVQYLPLNQMKFRFTLVELKDTNAFSITGGRVYVGRKMVAFVHNDDELAGVLAHELGHIVTHQGATEVTARLRELLGVTQVGDRADVFDKFHQLLENGARKRWKGSGEEGEQQVADQVALYAMARAGFAPHAFVEFWDRFQQTHGKGGTWLSNFFGTTKPSERRLGLMLKNISALPSGCADLKPKPSTEEFAGWQAAVIAYTGFGTKESLPGLVFKQALARPLRPDVTHLRFSPDGKYILSQDEGGIHVLTREPFEVLFYIPAVDAYNAQFSPDSRFIVFHNASLRVEIWSVPEQRRSAVHEITIVKPCLQSALSPDGSVLACLNSGMELSLLDVETGSALVTKKEFVPWDALAFCAYSLSRTSGREPHLMAMKFSPEGRYFLAGSSLRHFAWDMNAKREISLPGPIKSALEHSFAFVGPDRIVGLNASDPHKSHMLRFPSGERLQEMVLGPGVELESATRGDYFLVSPLKNNAMGLVDTKKGHLTIEFKHAAADVYDQTMVTEETTGKLILHSLQNLASDSPGLAVAKLPQARLTPLRAAAISSDFNWLAISQSSRGAVWDVAHNIQTTELKSFHGAWFAPNMVAYIDFPKSGDTERMIARVDPVFGHAVAGYKIGDDIASQVGSYLVVSKPRAPNTKPTATVSPEIACLLAVMRNYITEGSSVRDEDVEVHDVRDGHLVWSHYFPNEVPWFSMESERIILLWSLKTAGGRDQLDKYPDIKKAAAIDDDLLEEVDLQSDKVVRKLLIPTNKGSFSVRQIWGLGDWIVVAASGDQVLTYSFVSGQQQGHLFGTNPAFSGKGLIAVENEASQLSVYDLASSQLKHQYSFTDPILFKRFSPDGSRMFVFTADQTAYILDLTAKD